PGPGTSPVRFHGPTVRLARPPDGDPLHALPRNPLRLPARRLGGARPRQAAGRRAGRLPRDPRPLPRPDQQGRSRSGVPVGPPDFRGAPPHGKVTRLARGSSAEGDPRPAWISSPPSWILSRRP